jgi:hypothetical protein
MLAVTKRMPQLGLGAWRGIYGALRWSAVTADVVVLRSYG